MGITVSFLCAQSWAGSSKTKDDNCDGIIIRGIKYKRELIKRGLYVPFQLSVDHTTNILYFNVTDNKKDLADIIACIDLKTGKYEAISRPSAGLATVVDNKNHIVYLIYADGVYTYNHTTKDFKLIEIDNIVWKMFNKDGLYYTVYDSNVLFVYKNDESRRLTEVELPNEPDICANTIGVDKNGNIWIGVRGHALFCYIKDEKRMVSVGSYFAEEFCTDNDGNLYFSANDGVYAIGDDRSIELLFHEPSVYGLAFDADNNIIYSNNKQIVRLKRINDKYNL